MSYILYDWERILLQSQDSDSKYYQVTYKRFDQWTDELF